MRKTAIELSDNDLNQWVLLQQLIVERGVSKVAENLGLTQPTVSTTRAKMRRTFGDDLFLRTPPGMVPTPFAEQLAEPAAQALALIHSGPNQRERFGPASAQRSMTIARPTSARSSMAASKVDLAIGLLSLLEGGFFQRRLFRQRFVCLARRGHRIDKKKLTLTDFRVG